MFKHPTVDAERKSKETRGDACIFLDKKLPETIVEVKAEYGTQPASDPVIRCCVAYHQFTHLFFIQNAISGNSASSLNNSNTESICARTLFLRCSSVRKVFVSAAFNLATASYISQESACSCPIRSMFSSNSWNSSQKREIGMEPTLFLNSYFSWSACFLSFEQCLPFNIMLCFIVFSQHTMIPFSCWMFAAELADSFIGSSTKT